ncbi:MAG TPA: TetR/AcrR family transcriptional regulator C-terminal domain-containing protein [Anaeromyxobacteraceae bacterium]|nr:TetR/AcrR family transcriptional regulator C-terminal domain-containing protein [Anaeromyxobacteraceae bacterium]
MVFVPYRDPRATRRAPLDRAQVVRAALALVDEVGLDELTMRRLAERLGIQAASLYKHVKDKDELLVLLADEISAGIADPPSSGTWQSRLAALARNARRGLRAHRDGARVLAATAPFGPRRLARIETVLALLRGAGLSRRDAVHAAHHLNKFLTEFVADEDRYASAAAAAGSRRKMFAEVRALFRSLPPERYPVLVELADDLAEDDPDDLFEFGIAAWIRALEPLARRR